MLLEMNEKLRAWLLESNPWWKENDLKQDIHPRILYNEISKYLGKKQILAISGIRRVGKTSLMHLLIKDLLAKIHPQEIVYFSFDDFMALDVLELLEAHTQITGKTAKYLFLDEVQKLDGWIEKIKKIYDSKGIKMVISGSESLFVRKKSKESLAGRIFEFRLSPLGFKEYLMFKNIEPNYNLYRKEIEKAFSAYLLTGGFPELADEEDRQFIRKYIKEGILDKIIYSDIPKSYRLDDPSVLMTIINILFENPGMIIEINDLSRELGIARQTLSKYLFYLESSLLVKKLYNYSRNRSTSEKKLKKYYPAFSSSAISMREDIEYISLLVENLCVLHSGASFFWRTPQKDEVDIVLEGPIVPIEVKYRNDPGEKGLEKFMDIYDAKKGYVITKDTQKVEGNISYIPLIKWLME